MTWFFAARTSNTLFITLTLPAAILKTIVLIAGVLIKQKIIRAKISITILVNSTTVVANVVLKKTLTLIGNAKVLLSLSHSILGQII